MPRVKWEDFDGGLNVSSAPENMLKGEMRRNKGIHPIMKKSARSRDGSALIRSSRTAERLWHYGSEDMAITEGSGTGEWEMYVGSTLEIDDASWAASTEYIPMVIDAQPTLASTNTNEYSYITFDSQPAKFYGGDAHTMGIAPPGNPTVTETNLGAGTLPNGTYKYHITYKNTTTGTRSNGNATSQSVTIGSGPSDVSVTFSASSESEVDKVEIWRTVVSGAAFFYVAEVNDTASPYTDTTADASLSATELPTDNDQTAGTGQAGAVGHYGFDGRYWTSDNHFGDTLIYSPAGRTEYLTGGSIKLPGFQRVFGLLQIGASLYAFTSANVWKISATDTAGTFDVEKTAAPGTNHQFTIVQNADTVYYLANDNCLYSFDGATATKLNSDPISKWLRYENVGLGLTQRDDPDATDVVNTAPAGGVDANQKMTHAEYYRGEYFISDRTTTLAYNLDAGTWRNVGLSLRCMHTPPAIDELWAGWGSKVIKLEKDGEVQDDTTDVPIDWEGPHYQVQDLNEKAILRKIIVDMDMNDETLTFYVIVDGAETSLGTFTASSRQEFLFNELRVGKRFGWRIAGSVGARVELFAITFDIYVPSEIEAQRIEQVDPQETATTDRL